MSAFTQVALCTSDIARTTRLLTEALGFANAGGRPRWGAWAARVQELPTGDDTYCMMWWLVGGQDFFQFELFHHTSPPQRPRSTDWRPSDLGWVRFGVAVADLDATLDLLGQAGVSPLTDPVERDGVRRVCVREPGADAIIELTEGGAGPAVVSATASVSDLGAVRRFFADALRLVEIDPLLLHRPDDEALWGLAGARRECAVFRVGDALVEFVRYEEPSPRPPVPGALLSDQGIMNIALGYRDRAEMAAALEALYEVGATSSNDLPDVSGGVYLRIVDGLSIELLLVPPDLDDVFGFQRHALAAPGAAASAARTA
ncbi:VOC family protein [Microbacterium sp. RD1]|uniref:VOC family protein n=1 Tax=Microbacterium sp. RD1 TaxID=3457313 RepID=UPI003FA57AD9